MRPSIFVSFVLLVTGVFDVSGQAIPKMFVPKTASQHHTHILDSTEGSFTNTTKFEALTTGFGQPVQRVCYVPFAAFQGLLKALRTSRDTATVAMDFASYDPAFPCPATPAFKKKELIYLFSGLPCTPYATVCSASRYFAFYPLDSSFREIPAKTAEAWKRAFALAYLPSLLGTIDHLDQLNLRQGLPSDTRAIYYDWIDFKAWFITEPTYHPVVLSGFDIVLACYDRLGWRLYGKTFRNRLIVQYEFVQNPLDPTVGRYFYIDDQPGFDARDSAQRYHNGRRGRGGDNGHLCPPNCP